MKLTDSEMKLMEIIWDNNKITSMDLVVICEEKLSWKKSTTYTMLKKLQNKKMVANRNTIVRYKKTKAQYEKELREEAIREYFDCSLPQFLTAFVREKKLSREDIAELEQIISEYKEGLDD